MNHLAVLFAIAAASVLASQEPEPATMKAIRFHEFGDAKVLVYEDAPKPVAAANEVLVRVRAAGVNPVDWKIRSGAAKALNSKLPQIPGFDVAGVVESVGADVKRLKVGDEVYSYISLRRGGAYAQYAAIAENEVALKPTKLDFERSAAVPLAALTAWQALFDTAKLEAGQTVLVHAAAGGVGHFAVQLAKAKGARVIATASEGNHLFLKSLGADECIDYRTQKFEELARDVDVVLDAVGGDTLARSYGVLKKGGIVVSIVAAPDEKKAAELGVRVARILVQPNAAQLAEIAALVDEGKVRPMIAEVVPLAEAQRAHELSEAGHVRGKLVLRVPRK